MRQCCIAAELESLNLECCKEVSDKFLIDSFPEEEYEAIDSSSLFSSTRHPHSSGMTAEGTGNMNSSGNNNNNSNNSMSSSSSLENIDYHIPPPVSSSFHVDDINVEMEQQNSGGNLGENDPMAVESDSMMQTEAARANCKSPNSVGYVENSMASSHVNESFHSIDASMLVEEPLPSVWNNESILVSEPNNDSFGPHSEVNSAFQPINVEYLPFYSPIQSPINRGSTYNTYQSSSKVQQRNRKMKFPLLKNLKRLNISECPAITDHALAFLARNCPHLRMLNVRQCDLISRDGIINIKRHCHDVRILHSL